MSSPSKPAVPGAIPRAESLYLDLIRSLAAFFVVLDHAPNLYDLPFVPRWGHHAVIVFFVLSGYVISNVADTREKTPRVFIVSRLSRLWSVLVPAVIVTVACDALGHMFGSHPAAYHGAPADHPVIRILALLTFTSETWVSIQPLSNGVVWSLCAEFWYYMLFAAWVFVPPGKWRWTALTVVTLLAGPKALLLLPIWLFGVMLQRFDRLRRLSPATLVGLLVAGTAFIAWTLAAHAYDPPIAWMAEAVGPWLFNQLDQARVFWFDWIFGLAVTLHIAGIRAIAGRLGLERAAAAIRWCAGISFALYLLHMPILTLTAAFLPRSAGLLGIALTLLTIALLGPSIEQSKHWWRRTLTASAAWLLSPAALGRFLPQQA